MQQKVLHLYPPRSTKVGRKILEDFCVEALRLFLPPLLFLSCCLFLCYCFLSLFVRKLFVAASSFLFCSSSSSGEDQAPPFQQHLLAQAFALSQGQHHQADLLLIFFLLLLLFKLLLLLVLGEVHSVSFPFAKLGLRLSSFEALGSCEDSPRDGYE